MGHVTPSLAGKLLVAGPAIFDPSFARSVVLVCEHDEGGALGLILDRASDVPVADHLPEWVAPLAEPAVVFIGGPVAPDVAVGLGLIDPGEGGPPGWRPVTGGLGLVDLAEKGAVAALERLRVFSGYAGWTPGQLEAELGEAAAWIVLDAEPGDMFTDRPDRLRREILRRQSGPVRLLADYPPDPSLN